MSRSYRDQPTQGLFFTLNEQPLLDQDAKFWLTSLDTHLTAYRRTKTDSEESRANKARICATIAGIGMAIASHFGHGVATLSDLESLPMVNAGARSFELFSAHTDRLEAVANKRLS